MDDTASSGGTSTRAPSDGGARRPRPREIVARHLLVMHVDSSQVPRNITRTRAQALTRAQEALRRARAGEDFAGLAREFSDEPGAAESGGLLPRFGRGQMVPAFEDAAFQLEPNELSDVVETNFGFHVIRRIE